MAPPNRQRAKLVEGETPIRELRGHFFDAIQLGLFVRIGGVFPGAGPLERDPHTAQDLPQPLPADLHPAGRITGQIVGELANTPVRERAAQLARTGLGRRNDVRDVIVGDAAGTATRPLRIQAVQTLLVVFRAVLSEHVEEGWRRSA
jgi:hypothetical protein